MNMFPTLHGIKQHFLCYANIFSVSLFFPQKQMKKAERE